MTDEEQQQEEAELTKKLLLPAWITNLTKTNRTKRSTLYTETDYATTRFNSTLDLGQQWRNLQLQTNDLIFTAINELKLNIETKLRLDNYKKIKEKGAKTEFFRFEDIFREVPNSTKTRQKRTFKTKASSTTCSYGRAGRGSRHFYGDV